MQSGLRPARPQAAVDRATAFAAKDFAGIVLCVAVGIAGAWILQRQSISRWWRIPAGTVAGLTFLGALSELQYVVRDSLLRTVQYLMLAVVVAVGIYSF
jgi:hypothetical protein